MINVKISRVFIIVSTSTNMIILRQIGHQLLIFVEDNVLVYNVETKTHKTMKIPQPPAQPNLTKSLEEVLKPENRRISSVCASKDAQFLTVTLQNRQLVIYNSKFEVVRNVLTKRAVSKARFINQNDVLVADKTGDVYLYQIEETVEPRLLLGHLSMLLDVAVSECGRYVVTCDRDEKIRISSFPNAYNIVSYCLGHREFVSNLEISGDVLISASGDGTIRFWNVADGKQVFLVNTNDYVKDKSVVERFCKDMDGEKVDVSALPVTDMGVFENIVGVTLLGFKGVQLYRLIRCGEGQLDVKLMQCVVVDPHVICFSLSRELFILTESELLVYNLGVDGYEKGNSDDIAEFYENCRSLWAKTCGSSGISALYKRKFDNVQDYLEKKRLRLENKS